jgi:hypothetical protein
MESMFKELNALMELYNDGLVCKGECYVKMVDLLLAMGTKLQDNNCAMAKGESLTEQCVCTLKNTVL